MNDGPAVRHRRSIRLQWRDYGQPGAYFVTICTRDRECLFGEIADGRMWLNDMGHAVEAEWLNTAHIRPQVELGAYVVMPNHFHAIVVIVDNGRDVLAGRGILDDRGVSEYAPTEFRSPSQTIGAIVRGFKSAVTKRINAIRGTPGLPVWQRNYYEHVIRNDDELDRIRQYIVDNSVQWAMDRENPMAGAQM